jgi:riboflavin kinase/FMN adenylyltransferase
MDVVAGVDALRPEHGPLFAVVGVFDGLHRGHAYLLDHLVREAAARSARPCVITFDHHPDEVLTGSAPPLLMHPDERLERLGEAGVAVTVVQHFDEAVRRTTYDAFIGMIEARTPLAGLLMTPDAAFGFERRGTPETLAALGRERGFEVVVVPPFTIDGRAVRSSDIRAAIAAGDLDRAAVLLGRPVSLRGEVGDGRIELGWPLALPPDGVYEGRVDGRTASVAIEGGTVRVAGPAGGGSVRVELLA